MDQALARLSAFAERHKVALALAATGAGSYYIYTKLSPWAEEAGFMISGLYHFTRHSVRRFMGGIGESADELMSTDGRPLGREDTPLGRQFEKLLATGDRLLDIQLGENPFAESSTPNGRTDKGLYEKLSRIFNLKSLRAQLKTGSKEKKEIEKWEVFLASGLAQMLTAVYTLALLNATTKVILSIFHRHMLHAHVRSLNQDKKSAESRVVPPADIEKILSDPVAFEAFISRDPELKRLSNGRPVLEATQDPQVLARIVRLCCEKGEIGLPAASPEELAIVQQERTEKAGKQVLGLLSYLMGEGLERLAEHVKKQVTRVVARREGFSAQILSYEDMAALLLEISNDIQETAPDAKKSFDGKGEKKGNEDKEYSGLEAAWRSTESGAPPETAVVDSKCRDRNRKCKLADFALPASYRPDLSHKKVESDFARDAKSSAGSSGELEQPSGVRREPFLALSRNERFMVADMVAELRAVMMTESFEKVLRTNVQEALCALNSCVHPMFQPPQAKEGKLSSVMAIVRLTKLCRSILPVKSSTSKSSSKSVTPAPDGSVAAMPAQPPTKSRRPARDQRIIAALQTSKTLRRFCEIVFFPMDGKLTID